MQTYIPIIALVFECAGLAVFAGSLVCWLRTLLRARKAGILDYSMFALHPLFLLCTVFAGVLLWSAVRYLRAADTEGFRVSIGAVILFLSVLVWNTGFVTKEGLYMTGTKCNPLTLRRENGLLLFLPKRRDVRVSKPIVYENMPENREKFASLMQSSEP